MGRKNPRNKENPSKKKQPTHYLDPISWKTSYPSWAFDRLDCSCEKWSVSSCKDICNKILFKLKSFEEMTWDAILKQTHDDGKSSNHYLNIEDLSKDASEKLARLHVDFELLFSLRLQNTERLIGLLDDGVFHIIWYDQNHEVCVSTKKHT